MNDLFIKLGCRFTEEEKESCIEVIYTLLDLANEARKRGILVLEDEVSQEEENIFLKHGISLVVDGTDPDLLKDVLETMILGDGHTGAALLERLIMLKGIQAIQAGENPRIMAYRLSAMLGEAYVSRVCNAYEGKREENLKRIQDFLETWKGRKPLPECEAFERIMLDVHFGVSQMIRFIDWQTFLVAMNGCSEEFVSRVLLDYLSVRRAFDYIEDQTNLGELPVSVILRAQEEMMEVYRKLENSGEIRGIRKVMEEMKQFQETGQIPQIGEGVTMALYAYEIDKPSAE